MTVNISSNFVSGWLSLSVCLFSCLCLCLALSVCLCAAAVHAESTNVLVI